MLMVFSIKSSYPLLLESDFAIGTPANAPAERCDDASLTRSYIVFSANR